jgi:hypothetical protein
MQFPVAGTSFLLPSAASPSGMDVQPLIPTDGISVYLRDGCSTVDAQ